VDGCGGAPKEMKIGGVRGRRCGTVKAVGAPLRMTRVAFTR
jgi:hypothetical protein